MSSSRPSEGFFQKNHDFFHVSIELPTLRFSLYTLVLLNIQFVNFSSIFKNNIVYDLNIDFVITWKFEKFTTHILYTYSRVPNKRTGRLLENEKKSHLYALIQTYTFINFQQKVPPIRLFPPILLLIFKEISHLYFYSEPSSIRNSRVSSSFN